jgi:hypothetical protein
MTDVPANHANSRELLTEIIYKEESYAIIGACFKVYDEKGCGFLEPVYQENQIKETPNAQRPTLNAQFRVSARLSVGRWAFVFFGHYPGWEYKRIAKTQRIKAKTDLCDVSL